MWGKLGQGAMSLDRERMERKERILLKCKEGKKTSKEEEPRHVGKVASVMTFEVFSDNASISVFPNLPKKFLKCHGRSHKLF